MDYLMDTLKLDPQTIWMLAAAYVVLAVLVSLLSFNRRVDGLALFFFGILLTPVFSLIVLLRSPRKPKWNPGTTGTECTKCGYTYFDARTHCTVCGNKLHDS